MKRIKIALSIAALAGTVGAVSMSSVTSANEAGSKCDCQYQSGAYGVIQNNDCIVVNCWRPLDE